MFNSLGALLDQLLLYGIEAVEVAVFAVFVVKGSVSVVWKTDLERSWFLQGWHSELIENRVFHELLRSAPEVRVELKYALDDLLQLRTALRELLEQSALLPSRSHAVEVILGGLVCDKAGVFIILFAENL